MVTPSPCQRKWLPYARSWSVLAASVAARTPRTGTCCLNWPREKKRKILMHTASSCNNMAKSTHFQFWVAVKTVQQDLSVLKLTNQHWTCLNVATVALPALQCRLYTIIFPPANHHMNKNCIFARRSTWESRSHLNIVSLARWNDFLLSSWHQLPQTEIHSCALFLRLTLTAANWVTGFLDLFKARLPPGQYWQGPRSQGGNGERSYIC